ncbi:MAG: hypothetical protein COT90_04730 [Candidatus Diapherotrites archaeon CG10_big_fil_rev_8_21_14_0_10_31_34]|nr:MAG: hypothetical protein COT90_04730 [Candidatus Diapherotrites archaeon CG10_big_fil_rev_8_21_14_0_10_31_34]PJA18907.1 MAG: hypothetical protein COX63_01865 [Candidatus Diapherotrites archaeon CG_4_10_14_0_2_um_filter_31_5]
MSKTKKVHSTGRFGSRYGVGIRKRVLKVELQQKQKQNCPDCNHGILKRKASGIYECSKCNKQIAGGAYVPETMTGSLIKKIVSQKKFSSGIEELNEIKEQPFSEKVEQKGEEKKESKKEKLLTKAKSVLGMQTFSKKFDQKHEHKKEEKKEDKK